MYPEIFRVGNFPINTYGVLLAIGLLLALVVAARLAARDVIPRDKIYDLGLWTIIGGLIGSKILMFFTEDNVQIFSLDFLRSGGVYYGGFIGGFLTLFFLIHYYKLESRKKRLFRTFDTAGEFNFASSFSSSPLQIKAVAFSPAGFLVTNY